MNKKKDNDGNLSNSFNVDCDLFYYDFIKKRNKFQSNYYDTMSKIVIKIVKMNGPMKKVWYLSSSTNFKCSMPTLKAFHHNHNQPNNCYDFYWFFFNIFVLFCVEKKAASYIFCNSSVVFSINEIKKWIFEFIVNKIGTKVLFIESVFKAIIVN